MSGEPGGGGGDGFLGCGEPEDVVGAEQSAGGLGLVHGVALAQVFQRLDDTTHGPGAGGEAERFGSVGEGGQLVESAEGGGAALGDGFEVRGEGIEEGSKAGCGWGRGGVVGEFVGGVVLNGEWRLCSRRT